MLCYWRCCPWLLLGTLLAGTLEAAPRVELELVTEPGFPITGSHAWHRVLTEIGVDGLRIRTARGGEEVTVQVRGSRANPTYQVTGLLSRGNRLRLPGATFTQRDRRGIKTYLAKLRAGGLEAVSREPQEAFGLTAKQLAEAVEDLTAPMVMATQGEPPESIVNAISQRTTLELVVHPAAATVLSTATACEEEYQGLSMGTALAATLRPLGLMLQPERSPGGPTRHVVLVATAAAEAWPVGWPPEGKPRQLVPKLYEFLTVEAVDSPLSEVLAVLQARLEIPFLVDRNALAAQRIELDGHQVKLPPGRTYYRKALDRVLYQARLKSELRIDEAGRPFVWITTIKS